MNKNIIEKKNEKELFKQFVKIAKERNKILTKKLETMEKKGLLDPKRLYYEYHYKELKEYKRSNEIKFLISSGGGEMDDPYKEDYMIICPYCGEDDIEKLDYDEYLCKECKNTFDEYELNRD